MDLGAGRGKWVGGIISDIEGLVLSTDMTEGREGQALLFTQVVVFTCIYRLQHGSMELN